MADGGEVLANYGHRIGENLLWHTEEARFYWCDIYDGRLYGYKPASGTPE